MGGRGSGTWHRWCKKQTVQDSQVLAIGALRPCLYQGGSGTVTWTWPGGHQSSVGIRVTGYPGDLLLTVSYCWQNRESVRIPIPLQSTATAFNGRRWWFSCPLVLGTRRCLRRVGMLYLPPGAKYFGCRLCHELTYESSQKAHQWERWLDRQDRLKERFEGLEV